MAQSQAQTRQPLKIDLQFLLFHYPDRALYWIQCHRDQVPLLGLRGP